MSAAPESHPWWASLRHGGFLLDEKRLSEHFPQAPERDLSSWALEQLRGALTDLAASPDETEARTRVLTVLLEVACGLDGTSGGTWNRRLDATWTNRSITGEAVKPAHVWDGPLGRRLPVFTTPEPRLGVGHGRRAVARVLEWLRARNEPLAVLSNGHQLRLIWASADTHAWCESDAALWLVEGRAGLQLDALRILLSPTALTPVEDTTGRKLSPLLRGIVDSRKGQAELSAMLGERVRTAVERLIQSHGPFLNALERPPAPADTYVAACRVMMRLVFGFFAEARDLLPRSHGAYFTGYSLAGLLAELDRSAGSGKAERLAHRYCAWFDTFQHYPVMAWKREGGDKAHKNGVHFQKEAATRALKTHLDTVITPALREFIEQNTAPTFAFLSAVLEPSEVFDRLRDRLDEIHTLSSEPDLQAEKYRALRDDDVFQKARAALDLWCALWFWPFDQLALAPTPLDFSQPSAEALQIATELRRLHRFFHRELEVPDVFSPERRAGHPHAGFDALLGNPPWETVQPNSKEWFSNVDPLYRA